MLHGNCWIYWRCTLPSSTSCDVVSRPLLLLWIGLGVQASRQQNQEGGTCCIRLVVWITRHVGICRSGLFCGLRWRLLSCIPIESGVGVGWEFGWRIWIYWDAQEAFHGRLFGVPFPRCMQSCLRLPMAAAFSAACSSCLCSLATLRTFLFCSFVCLAIHELGLFKFCGAKIGEF